MSTSAGDVLEVQGDGGTIEMETVGFTGRIDKDEDRRNDGNTYKGLLSNKEYNKRKAKVEETMDMQAYKYKKVNEMVAKDEAKRQEADKARQERMEKKKAALKAELKTEGASKASESKEGSSSDSKKKKKKKIAATLSFDDDEEEDQE